MSNLPAEGWAVRYDGKITYTKHGATFMDRAPEREGWRCYFVARHGLDYTTWTYRPVTTTSTTEGATA